MKRMGWCVVMAAVTCGSVAELSAAERARVNVRDFGAVADGKTDDAPAFQKAIDSLGTAGGTVHAPAGTYFLGMQGKVKVACPAPQDYVGFAVRLQSGVTLTGDGPGATVLLASLHTELDQQYSVLP